MWTPWGGIKTDRKSENDRSRKGTWAKGGGGKGPENQMGVKRDPGLEDSLRQSTVHGE